jgi:hypothetical protein
LKIDSDAVQRHLEVFLKKTTEGLAAPPEYLEMTASALDEICNGCGPAGWKWDIVPDTLYGLSITNACNIHDFMYHFGETKDDKNVSDTVFLDNMNTLISNAKSNRILTWLRRRRAKKYYWAVSKFGDDAFNA